MGKYEQIAYQVLETDRNIEIRQLEGFKTTTVKESSFKGVAGFRMLFDYISGNNQEKQKISMTVPVINTLKPSPMSMEFVLPTSYTTGNPPQPNNDKIKIKTYPAQVVASIRFSGFISEKRVNKHTEKLVMWLNKKALTPKGPFRLSRYNSPFSLPFLRRHEIWIEIDHASH